MSNDNGTNNENKGTYFPELDYEARGHTPFGTRMEKAGKDGGDDMIAPEGNFCDRCILYYKNLSKAKVIDPGVWPITCRGDKSKYIENVDPKIMAQLPPETREELICSLDPVAWVEKHFKVYPYWYQKEMLRCSSQFKVARAGRRLGKTATMCMDIWHSAFTKEGKDVLGYTILVVCPYEAQVKKIFEDLLALSQQSPAVAASIKSVRKSSPFEITLHNGASIRGFPAARKTGAASKKIRGQGAHKVYLDEEDYMADEDIETVLAVLVDQPDTAIWGASTPTGIRGKYWKMCTVKQDGFKEFHFISAESPRWTLKMEKLLRSVYSQGGYDREFNAEFGQPAQGVFRQTDLDRCLRKYAYADIEKNPMFHYVMGVDWNKHTGTHMVMLEHGVDANEQHFYRLVDKQVIRRTEFTQHDGVEAVVAMDKKWKPDFIYVDEGYGAMQIEALWRHDKNNPHLNLDYRRRIVPVFGNQMIELPDPRGGEPLKKPVKPFMVDMLAHWVELGLMQFPESEDTHSTLIEEEMPFLNVGVVQQMRVFKVEKYSPTGVPRYSQGYEHTLMALCFAALGMTLNFSEVRKGGGINQIAYNPEPFGKPSEQKTEPIDLQKRSEEFKKKKEELKPDRNLVDKPRNVFGLKKGIVDGTGFRRPSILGRSGPFRGNGGSSGRIIP